MQYSPTEIIFAATNACNLNCAHCFVSRTPNKLNIQDSITFLQNCILESKENQALPKIEKIGFTGGEPFLYLDFIIALTKTALENDLLFDQIMTNGDWWKTEADLNETLQKLYNAGYDGKIGLSYDNFHGQKPERMQTFIQQVQKIFGPDSINIQTVISDKKSGESLPLVPAVPASTTPSSGDTPQRPVQIYYLPQTFPSEDTRAWQARHWFKDDYCEGPGQILYIHPNGKIAPCCGFANENPELVIGTINDSFSKIIENASKNKMIDICYTKGLGKYRKDLKKHLRKKGKKYPGKCSDICSFCDYVCKITRN